MAIASVNGNEQALDLAPVLAGVRRLTLLADGAEDPDAVFAALARELIATMGAEEVHIHRLSPSVE